MSKSEKSFYNTVSDTLFKLAVLGKANQSQHTLACCERRTEYPDQLGVKNSSIGLGRCRSLSLTDRYLMTTTPKVASKPKLQRQSSIDSASSNASVNSRSSVLEMLDEKTRVSKPGPVLPTRFNGRPCPKPSTTTVDATASRIPPNATRRVVVIRSRNISSTSSNRPLTLGSQGLAAAVGSSTLHTVHPTVGNATRKNAVLTANAALKTYITNVHVSSLGNTSSSSNSNVSCDSRNCHDGDGMTVIEILEEKARLACPHPPVVPARYAASITTSGATATAAVPAIGVRRGRGKASTLDEKQQVDNTGHHVDHNNEALPAMPGAVFVPGYSTSFNNNHDIDMDSCNDEIALDLPELRPDQSSDDISAESVHRGIALAVEVDEQQEPQVQAIPILQEADKKQVPFHKSKLFCRIALIILVSIVVIGGSTITIILLGGDHDSGAEGGGGRENLGIRQEIEALVGREELESPDSPYARALEWMIHHDPMELVPGVDSNFVQRYITAYFYYATTTDGPWLTCNPVVGSESEFCYLSSEEKDIAATRWLSAVHECQFAGVACDEKNQIVGLGLSKFFHFCGGSTCAI
jgi:hypothetical protein